MSDTIGIKITGAKDVKSIAFSADQETIEVRMMDGWLVSYERCHRSR